MVLKQIFKKRSRQGFTIVELLVVVVVIAILATISVVAYNGVQSDARDSVRKQDLGRLRTAINRYYAKEGDYAVSGCGNAATGSGYLNSDYDGAGSLLSVNQCLVAGGYIPKEYIDPSGSGSCSGLTCYTYMKASCAGGTYLYAHIANLPQIGNEADATCPAQVNWDTSYGVNYVLKVD